MVSKSSAGGFVSWIIGRLRAVDWLLVAAAGIITAAGLATMSSFGGSGSFFAKQSVWFAISLAVFFIASLFDYRFIRKTSAVVTVFVVACLALGSLLIVGDFIKGTRGWFDFGVFFFQPAGFATLSLILVLSKYFERRHVEIAHFRHILISAVYALLIVGLILLQPDFGSAMIAVAVWVGMILLSGISKKHLLAVFLTAALVAGSLWVYVFKDYQKQRIISFVYPMADIQGSGYNAFQSTVAVGSGGLFGKGIGYGTQSRLKFLPEYETDFVFAAFAEEWGFVGILFLFSLYGIVIWRILKFAYHGASNFEILFASGVAIMFMSHLIVHVGMNIGLLPVTGITLPFMSYGGSHLLLEYMSLGILVGMSRYGRAAHKDVMKNEFLGF